MISSSYIKAAFLALWLLSANMLMATNTVPQPFNHKDQSYLYRTKLEAFSFHFSGLMFFKCTGDQQYLASFTTETGITLFAMTINHSKIKVTQLMKEMKKPFFMGMIKTDMRFLLGTDLKSSNTSYAPVPGSALFFAKAKGGKNFYEMDSSATFITHMVKASIDKPSRTITLSDYVGTIPQKLQISHAGLPIKIAFEYIQRNQEETTSP
jgi:hypothetical protein